MHSNRQDVILSGARESSLVLGVDASSLKGIVQSFGSLCASPPNSPNSYVAKTALPVASMCISDVEDETSSGEYFEKRATRD